MAHAATGALRANYYSVITAPAFEPGNVHLTRWRSARRTYPPIDGTAPGQSVLKKPTLMVWLPLRSRASTSSSYAVSASRNSVGTLSAFCVAGTCTS
jgi:hypothetical protein